MSETVLILGATSGIARALARVLSERGSDLILAGRNGEQLEAMAADVQVRTGQRARAVVFDALTMEDHPRFWEEIWAMGPIDGVVLAFGYLPDQATTETSFAEARRTIDVNFTGAVSILNLVAQSFTEHGRGWIAAISSVAADRGRQSNYTYGAAKAALSVYLGGLRNRLHASGVHVLEVKPGFVDTPMTEGLIDPNSPLVATPEVVALEIERAIRARRNVLYVPWYWQGIMTTIRSIPESIFKRLKL